MKFNCSGSSCLLASFLHFPPFPSDERCESVSSFLLHRERSRGAVQGQLHPAGGDGALQDEAWKIPHRTLHLQTQQHYLIPPDRSFQERIKLQTDLSLK